ncbi:Uma2 family endonuclease [Thermus thalpophilus]
MAVRHRFTVEELSALAGLHPATRWELLEGEVYEMAPIGSEHAGLLDWLLAALAHKVLGQVQLRVQSPLLLSQDSLPQPDLLLLKPRADFYTRAHPRAEDVLLLVEVGLSSLEFDRQVKLPLYARHGIPEVWLAGPAGLEVFREPKGGLYRLHRLVAKGEPIAPLLLPSVELLYDPPL